MRVLLADDHPGVREAIQSLLEPDFDVVGCVDNRESLLEIAKGLQPDVIVSCAHLRWRQEASERKQPGPDPPITMATGGSVGGEEGVDCKTVLLIGVGHGGSI
jgi:DNA-binding NarL/FixJ family response regulator